jgi:hypothetical protein
VVDELPPDTFGDESLIQSISKMSVPIAATVCPDPSREILTKVIDLVPFS